MNYSQANFELTKVFNEIKECHSPAGHIFIATHWTRYVNLLTLLPKLSSKSIVLEIGASILSSAISRIFGATVHTVHHELESEWPSNYRKDVVQCFPAEILRDPLPVADNTYDCILFDEVMEHLPVRPEFVVRQIICKLKAEGELIFTVPNFATSQKRLSFLFGKNPQDHMDPLFVYYAHHREPVMNECIDIVKSCGGTVIESQWTDFSFKAAAYKRAWYYLRQLRFGNIHPLIHRIIPSTRDYIFIRVKRNQEFKLNVADCIPPLSKTSEFRRSRS